MPELPYQTLGNYRLIERIGRGGMGDVYLAEKEVALHRQNERLQFAIKILSGAKVYVNDTYLSRFEEEMRSLSLLKHPNITRVVDAAEHQGDYYIVMDYYPGGTLYNKISKSGMDKDELIPILRQLADALDYAHDEGIIHRDIKPNNVFFDKRGNVYLGDFGISKSMTNNTSLTGPGITMGTMDYMAPEIWENEPHSHYSDLYALGITVYQLLTGRHPFGEKRTPGSLAISHRSEVPPAVTLFRPDLAYNVDRVIGKMMAKDPHKRYATATAFVQELDDAFRKPASNNPAAKVISANPSFNLPPQLNEAGATFHLHQFESHTGKIRRQERTFWGLLGVAIFAMLIISATIVIDVINQAIGAEMSVPEVAVVTDEVTEPVFTATGQTTVTVALMTPSIRGQIGATATIIPPTKTSLSRSATPSPTLVEVVPPIPVTATPSPSQTATATATPTLTNTATLTFTPTYTPTPQLLDPLIIIDQLRTASRNPVRFDCQLFTRSVEELQRVIIIGGDVPADEIQTLSGLIDEVSDPVPTLYQFCLENDQRDSSTVALSSFLSQGLYRQLAPRLQDARDAITVDRVEN